MSQPHVVVLEPIADSGLRVLRSRCDVTVLDGTADARRDASLATCAALVVRSTPVTAELINRAPRLRVIGRHGAGLDNIDLDHARAVGIAVVNTPHSNAESVAEYALTVMLLLVKGVLGASRALHAGELSTPGRSLPGQVVASGYVGHEITTRRLGVVGFGAIGRAVACKAMALGMDVAAYDPYVEGTVMELAGVRRVETLDELLTGSDVVSLHVPGRPGQPLLGERELALLPPGAILVNSARASLVEPTALVAAVERGRITAAALDVFDPEPPPAASPLLHTPGIFCTPHMAAMTHEALDRMAVDVANAVLEALGLP
ncbi:hydroxyacid dehydrogenase [Georgenia faecalis]|uniref:Hydroxyacid dehydrogenase n=1 Tax=Georgenia faecalis TaxID=2483799 RepID=A0ABV9DBL7_9MICO|nr:hydroxyacid dehydrogenase [Georgenia faecalis]